MGTAAGQFIATLADQHRVLVIGGFAVIAHGFNRPTMDADTWLEPLESPVSWADALQRVCARFSGLTVHGLSGRHKITGLEIARFPTPRSDQQG